MAEIIALRGAKRVGKLGVFGESVGDLGLLAAEPMNQFEDGVGLGGEVLDPG